MRVCVHDRPVINGSWVDKGTEGFYVGPAPNHYINYTCYMPKTRAFCSSDTVEFSPHDCKMPKTSSTDQLAMIFTDLLDVLKRPYPVTPFLQKGTNINDAVCHLE